jgi:hypothetical protein
MVRPIGQQMGVATGCAVVYDYWTRAGGCAWEPTADGSQVYTRYAPAVIIYLQRRRWYGLDAREEPVYVHQRGVGALVHPSEIVGVLDGPEGGLVTIDVASLGGAGA